MKKIVVKYPVIVFYVVCILLATILGLANMQLFPSSFAYALMFPQWSPALAAFVVVGIIGGKTGIFSLWEKTSIKKSSLKWGLIAVLIPLACCVAAYIALTLKEFGQVSMPTFTRSIGNYAICLLATIFGCYGEELGWRGFLLPQLNKKYSLFVSGLFVGLFWAFWHINLIQYGLSTFGLYALSVICFSLIITWLCSKTKNSIFVAIIFHTIINMCSLILFENVLPDISQKQTGGEFANMHLYTVLYGLYAIVFAVPCIFIAKKMLKKSTINQIQ